MLITSASAYAQAGANSYDVIETPEKFQNKTTQKALKSAVLRIFRGAVPIQGTNKTKVVTYFEKILFAGWTQTDQLGDIVSQRQDFFKVEYSYAARSPANFAFLNELTLKNMIKIAGGDYHPAARHNAMLVLGRLKAAGGSKPNAQALTTTGGLLDSAKSDNQHPAVRVAAMIGLIEHAKAGIPNAVKGQVETVILKVLREQDLVGQMTADGNSWLRIRAAEAAAAMGNPGPNNAIALKLIDILGDQEASLSLRCAAARSSGPLLKKIAGGANVKPKAIAGAVGNLVIDILNASAASSNARRLYHQTKSAEICIRNLSASGNDKAAVSDIKKEVLDTAALFSQNQADSDEIKTAIGTIKTALKNHSLSRDSAGR